MFFLRYDAFMGILSTYTDLDYEMASVLFNVGAVHAQLGAKERRWDLTFKRMRTVFEN